MVESFASTYLDRNQLDFRERGLFWFAVMAGIESDNNSGKGMQRCQTMPTEVKGDERISSDESRATGPDDSGDQKS